MLRKLCINDRIFHVDQDVLSNQSDYFRALFNPMFNDSTKEVITIKEIVDADNFQIILNYNHTGNLDLAINLPELINILETAQALAFDQVVQICVQELYRRTQIFDNFGDICDVLKVGEVLSVKQLFNACLERIALNFDAIDLEYFVKCDFTEDTVISLISYVEINSACDMSLLNLVEKWAEKRQITTRLHTALLTSQMNIIEERLWTPNICSPQQKQILQNALLQLKSLKSESCQLKDLESVFQSSLRSQKLNLCMLGTEIDSKEPDIQNDVHFYTFNPRLKRKTNESSFCDNENRMQLGILKGGSITTVPNGFILAGGEYKYGKSNWNMDIIKYEYSPGQPTKISKLGTLPFPRRHHTAVLIGQCLYLLGGFCRTRVMLADMIIIHLETGQQKTIDLPNRGYNIAATEYERNLVVAMNGSIYIYNDVNETWTHRVTLTTSVPNNVEFHFAFCNGHKLYLTCNFQQTVYSIDLSSADLLEYQEVGKLLNEAQKPCCQGPYLYNLAKSDVLDFDGSGEKVIERFDVRSGTSEEVFKFCSPIPVQDFPLFWIIK